MLLNLSRALLVLVALAGARPTAVAAQDAGASRGAAVADYGRTDALSWVVLGFSVLHHVDHVLRDNHSGWPFTRRVTPFTYSLAIYPIVGAAYALDAGPAAFVALDAAGSVGLLLAHSLLEPPDDQYDPWVDGSNRLGVQSPALGRIAQAVSLGLSTSLAGHLASSIADGREHGFTWRRSDSGGGGLSLSLGIPARDPGGAWRWAGSLAW